MKLLRKISIMSCLLATHGISHGAQINWEDWSFDYSINNNSSGLVLTDVQYKNKLILNKASMPVMRVKYDDDVCGPYADILSTGVSQSATQGAPNSACNNQAVCTRTFTLNGESMFEVGSNWQIGEYQIYQTYYFSENGYFDSRIYSRGLQCQVDHSHHANWMFDFDIDGAANDKIILPDGSSPRTEFNDLKTNTSSWTIGDTTSTTKATLTPSPDDGIPDSFSNVDLAVRAYNSSEVGRWRLGAYGEIGDNYLNNQSINNTDLVVWYVSHLAHSASEGASIWHSSGPRITVSSDTAPVEPPPTEPEPEPEPEPTNDNLLSNSGFESGKTGWDDCASSRNTQTTTGNPHSGSSVMRVRYGGCISQRVSIEAGKSYSLSCQARRNGSRWTAVQFSYRNTNNSYLSGSWKQINNSSWNEYTSSAVAPSNASYALVLLYSSGTGFFDTCSLTETDTNTQRARQASGMNILKNSDFEETLQDWGNCGEAQLIEATTDAASGVGAASLNSGGCLYQEFPVEAGRHYGMECLAKKSPDDQHSSVSFTIQDDKLNTLDRQEIAVESTSYEQVSASLVAPANSTTGTIVLYGESASSFDDCNVVEK